MRKGSIHSEDITLLNMYAPKNRASKYTKQKWTHLKGDIDKPTARAGNFNTPTVDRTSRQKVIRDIGNLNNSVN